MDAQLKVKHAGSANFATLIADPGLVAENQTILKSIQYEWEVAAYLHDVRRERLFVDEEGTPPMTTRSTAPTKGSSASSMTMSTI